MTPGFHVEPTLIRTRLEDPDPGPDPLTLLLAKERVEHLDRALRALPDQQEEVLRRSYGIGFAPEPYDYMANRLCLSRSRVGQIAANAKDALRRRGSHAAVQCLFGVNESRLHAVTYRGVGKGPHLQGSPLSNDERLGVADMVGARRLVVELDCEKGRTGSASEGHDLLVGFLESIEDGWPQLGG